MKGLKPQDAQHSLEGPWLQSVLEINAPCQIATRLNYSSAFEIASLVALDRLALFKICRCTSACLCATFANSEKPDFNSKDKIGSKGQKAKEHLHAE